MFLSRFARTNGSSVRFERSGAPQSSWVCGESGGISRLNVDAVNSQCDLVAEREAQVVDIVVVVVVGYTPSSRLRPHLLKIQRSLFGCFPKCGAVAIDYGVRSELV